jgi:hypothetical protein
MATITLDTLNGFLGKHINKICGNGFASDDDNHCAHFVSHALGLQFGITCATMTSGKKPGASIRVQELFPRCRTVGTWSSRPELTTTCLVFITNAGNVDVAKKTMVNVPRKHVGIFVKDAIWHYSNSQEKVVKQSPEQFSHHYKAPDNAMFYGTLL